MTSFITHNQDHTINQKVYGTHFEGRIEIPYKDLVKKLGEPMFGDGEKVQVEWVLEFDDGTVATIYDWNDSRSVHAIDDWHIGGFNSDAVEHIQDLFHDCVAEIF